MQCFNAESTFSLYSRSDSHSDCCLGNEQLEGGAHVFLFLCLTFWARSGPTLETSLGFCGWIKGTIMTFIELVISHKESWCHRSVHDQTIKLLSVRSHCPQSSCFGVWTRLFVLADEGDWIVQQVIHVDLHHLRRWFYLSSTCQSHKHLLGSCQLCLLPADDRLWPFIARWVCWYYLIGQRSQIWNILICFKR